MIVKLFTFLLFYFFNSKMMNIYETPTPLPLPLQLGSNEINEKKMSKCFQCKATFNLKKSNIGIRVVGTSTLYLCSLKCRHNFFN
jgi:hypothetical protein